MGNLNRSRDVERNEEQIKNRRENRKTEDRKQAGTEARNRMPKNVAKKVRKRRKR